MRSRTSAPSSPRFPRSAQRRRRRGDPRIGDNSGSWRSRARAPSTTARAARTAGRSSNELVEAGPALGIDPDHDLSRPLPSVDAAGPLLRLARHRPGGPRGRVLRRPRRLHLARPPPPNANLVAHAADQLRVRRQGPPWRIRSRRRSPSPAATARAARASGRARSPCASASSSSSCFSALRLAARKNSQVNSAEGHGAGLDHHHVAGRALVGERADVPFRLARARSPGRAPSPTR